MTFLNSLISPFNRTPARSNSDSGRASGPTVKPFHEVVETAEAFGLTVYLPGVARDGLEITAEEEVLRITGRRAWKQPEGWTQLYREGTDVPYELELNHDHAIDLDKIHAELKDGVLRVSLPKVEAIKPRKIAVA